MIPEKSNSLFTSSFARITYKSNRSNVLGVTKDRYITKPPHSLSFPDQAQKSNLLNPCRPSMKNIMIQAYYTELNTQHLQQRKLFRMYSIFYFTAKKNKEKAEHNTDVEDYIDFGFCAFLFAKNMKIRGKSDLFFFFTILTSGDDSVSVLLPGTYAFGLNL